MIPNFEKVVSRQQVQQIVDRSSKFIKPEGYDPEKISQAYDHLSLYKGPSKVLRFSSQLGRVESHNSMMIADKAAASEATPDFVSYSEFLPNYIKNSPLKREHSSTFKTMKYYPSRKHYLTNKTADTSTNNDEGQHPSV